MIFLLISRHFTYEKKYPAEGHKYLNNLRFLMICTSLKIDKLKKEFAKKLPLMSPLLDKK